MIRISATQIVQDIEDLLSYRDQLLSRGVPPGDVMVIIGCALGIRIAGGSS